MNKFLFAIIPLLLIFKHFYNSHKKQSNFFSEFSEEFLDLLKHSDLKFNSVHDFQYRH